jgi:hypothetical protein
MTSKAISKFVRRTSHVYPGGSAGCFVRNHLGNPALLSNRKIKEELGMAFMDPADSIRDTVADLVRWGHVAPASTPAARGYLRRLSVFS